MKKLNFPIILPSDGETIKTLENFIHSDDCPKWAKDVELSVKCNLETGFFVINITAK